MDLDNTDPTLCNETVTKLFNDQTNNPLVNATSLYNLYYFCAKGNETKLNDDEFSKPLVAIGVYIALASLCCIFAMGADFVHGMRKDRYEFRSKYFSLNVVSLTLITAAMKLPVDLSGSMPGNLDQTAKIGSIAFLCTSLAIFNPSLASMNNKELSVNIGGLVLFVVTVAANVFIEIGTGVIKDVGPFHVFEYKRKNRWRVGNIYYSIRYVRMAATYAGIMVMFLAISISTAIIIPSFKKTLDDKYQVKRQALNDEITIKQRRHGNNNRITTVEEITQYVTRFLIMAKTGSPEFVMARNILSYISLSFCACGMVIFTIVGCSFFKHFDKATNEYQSDYKWSTLFILLVQFLGNLLGTVFVGFRCYGCMKFRDFSFESHKWNLTKEKYWTDKLREWKKACTNRYRIAAASSNHPAARLLVNKYVYFMTNWGLSICIGLQSTFVLVIQIFMPCTVWVLRALMKRPCCRVPTTPAVATSQIEDLSGYVLQLDDEMKASPEVVEQISRSMKFRIESAKDKENNKVFNNNLLELLAAKRPDDDGFKGVEIFDDDDDQIKLSSSWSVPVITLASIAISSVPGIAKDQVQSLIQAIDEALLCIHPVEESFDRANEFVNIRKAATTLWVDAKATTTGAHTIDFPNDDQSSSSSSAAGLLMRRIKRSISSKYPEEIQTNERFFRLLRSMIADVLVACFSNLPRVVMMKCHANEIEKREASVEAAVKLLVKSTKIIEKLEECQLPAGLDPDKMASIEEWIIHLKQPSNSIITFNT